MAKKNIYSNFPVIGGVIGGSMYFLGKYIPCNFMAVIFSISELIFICILFFLIKYKAPKLYIFMTLSAALSIFMFILFLFIENRIVSNNIIKYIVVALIIAFFVIFLILESIMIIQLRKKR